MAVSVAGTFRNVAFSTSGHFIQNKIQSAESTGILKKNSPQKGKLDLVKVLPNYWQTASSEFNDNGDEDDGRDDDNGDNSNEAHDDDDYCNNC